MYRVIAMTRAGTVAYWDGRGSFDRRAWRAKTYGTEPEAERAAIELRNNRAFQFMEIGVEAVDAGRSSDAMSKL